MKKIAVTTLLMFCLLKYAGAQEPVQYRVILIGDAGEINKVRQAVLQDALQKNIPNKTVAVFLGDNIYPRGMELTDKGQQKSIDILRSQYEGLRKAGIPVYFIPGNHDWDKSGPDGYKKMLSVNQFLRQQNDTMLQMIPADACPGPHELVVADNLVIIAMDSEWWLYPFTNQTAETDCECKTKKDVLGKLHDILQRNKDKVILFATHHPFITYGPHGGYYNFKDHVFPLTSINKNWWLPLPVIGSLYPLLRKAFPPAQDVKNVLYSDMIKNVNEVLKTHPNLVHVSGHEHALQLINGDVLQLVSGAGAKHTPVKKGRGAMYAKSFSGYVTADILPGNNIRLSFHTYQNGVVKEDSVYNIPPKKYLPQTDALTTAVTGTVLKYNSTAALIK